MTLITITARMGSKRLPGKVLADVHGKPMLVRLLERVSGAGYPVAVCSGMSDENTPILDICKALKVPFIRGEEMDVMDRLIMTARVMKASTIVRVTGDNPLTDPILIKKMVEYHHKNKADYTYVAGPPRGTKPEVINVNSLAELHKVCTNMELRENMTPTLKTMNKVRCMPISGDIYDPELRLTVDYPEDLERIRQIYGAFDGNPPPLAELIKWLHVEHHAA